MTITIETKALRAGLDAVGRFCGRSWTAPALAAIRLTAGDGRVTLRATDMDTEGAVSLPADTNGTRIDTAVFGVRDMPRILRAAGGDTVAIEAVDAAKQVLGWQAGDVRLENDTLPAADHPTASTGGCVTGAPLSYRALTATLSADAVDAIYRALSYVSTEDTRFYLNGVALQRDRRGGPWSYRVAATDGHRLLMEEFPAPDAIADDGWTDWAILPRQTLRKLEPLLRAALKAGETVTLTLGRLAPRNSIDATETLTRQGAAAEAPAAPTLVEVRTAGWTVRANLILGAFPDVDRVVPPTAPADQILFDRRDLLRALTVLGCIDHRGVTDRGVMLTVATDGTCTLTRRVIGAGAGETRLTCAPDRQGRQVEVGVNIGYLARILRGYAGCETIALQITDASSPITVLSDEAPERLAVIMPMRL